MSQTVCFKFDLNLKKLSLLSVAASLWEIPTIKQEIIKYVLQVNRRNLLYKFAIVSSWKKVMEYALNQVENLHLPVELMEELRAMIVLIGEKIVIWYDHVVHDEVFPLELTPKLRWTPYGSIDEFRIFTEVMKKLPNLKFGMTETSSSISKFFLYSLFMTSGNLDNICEHMEEIRGSCQLNFDDLFLRCALMGYRTGADYFYEKVEDKEVINEKAIYFSLSEEDEPANRCYDYADEGKAAALFYLLNKMPKNQLKFFVLSHFLDIYGIFLKTWSYVPISMQILNYWDFLTYEDKFDVLTVTVKAIQKATFLKSTYPYNVIYLPVLAHVLAKTPGEIKLNFFLRPERHIYDFFTRLNFSAINLIVNDVDLVNHRGELLDVSKDLEIYLRGGDEKSQDINKYMELLKFSHDEKLKLLTFCDDLQVLDEMLVRELFNNAENVVKWHYFRKGEDVNGKEKLKETITPSFYIKHCLFDSLDKYLKWLYDADDEKLEKMKQELFSPEFICQNFWKVWILSNRDKSKNNCLKFFKYFFKTDEELSSFRETYVENERFLLSLLDLETDFCYYPMMEYTVMPYLNEIFEVFSVAPDKVTEIKRTIKENLNLWFDLYWDKFVFLHGIMKWICDSKEERIKIIQDFIHSPKGTLFCFKILKKDKDGAEDRYGVRRTAAYYLSIKWIFRHGDVIKIRDSIKALKRTRKFKYGDVNRVVKEFKYLLPKK